MNIVFNVNPLGLEGLGATLSSLIRNCSNAQELNLLFLCSEFRDDDKLNINQLLHSEHFNGITNYIDFNAKEIFGHLKSLHGDWTTYGRLLIANFIKDDTALYLDADLIVMLDVLTLRDFKFQGAVLAAVYGSTVAHALENSFFINRLGCSPDQSYFNAGVILFNLKEWREARIEEHWKGLANKYSSELVSHDQTLLNAVCKGEFAHLPFNFNSPWYPGEKKPEGADNSIIHFVGAPKPWDIFGKFVHKGYKTWRAYTSGSWQMKYSKLSRDKIRRTWKIRRSLMRHLKNLVYQVSN